MDITIKEDGTGKDFDGVRHIEVPSVESGSVEWVPEPSRIGVKHITENGTYRASDENLAGYLAVMVTVQPTQATGTNPDDGKQYTVVKDSFGNLLYIPVE